MALGHISKIQWFSVFLLRWLLLWTGHEDAIWMVQSFSVRPSRQHQWRATKAGIQQEASAAAPHLNIHSAPARSMISLLKAQSSKHNDTPAMERTWRYVKKPLLRIGAKGAAPSHGNSLRQLLEDHGAVKVKINTAPYNGDLEAAFETLKQLAVNSGAPVDIELLQSREAEQIILVSLPGIRKRIETGDFPPVETTENVRESN